MSVYRVNKTRDFTVMGNTHLRDKNLSLKAVGLLSKMLSFNDGWQFSTRGLAALCKEGPDAILSALKELEENGYLVRHRGRDDKGRMVSTEFDIYETPQAGLPHRDNPHRENPDVEKPDVENPHRENPAQINTDQVITQERNTLSKNYQSINLDGMDRMDERSEYEEIIKENLDYDILCQDPKFDKDRFREIMDIMLDAVCSTAPTVRINGEDMPQQVVKSRFLKLNSSHIEYVLEAMNKNPSDIRNIRAYLLTALYNASLTIDNYYSALVNHDFYGQDRSAGSKKLKTYDYTQFLALAQKEAIQNREVGDLRKSAIKECADKIRTLQKQNEQHKASKLRLYEKYAAGSITKEAYIQQKAAADVKIAENDGVIQRSHERMKELDSETACSDEKLDAVCEQYADCKALTYELTHAFISAVYIYDLDNIEIVWKFKDFLTTSEGEAK